MHIQADIKRKCQNLLITIYAAIIFECDMAEALFQPSNLLAILQELAKDIEENYKEHLEQHDRVASGDLLRSISTKVVVNGTAYEVWMDLADYWKYVEWDTKPHWPPPDAIARWIFIKPVIPRPDKNGHIPTPEQLTFLIGRKIAMEGTKGTHDLRDTKNAVIPMYEERLLEALERDTIDYIAKVLT